MIGKVNSAGGIKKLVVAQSSKTGTRNNFYVNLTCDFDPLVVIAFGPSYSSYNFQTKYRLTKNSAWQTYAGSNHNGIINISGRTITAGPFINNDIGPIHDGYILAFGFPD